MVAGSTIPRAGGAGRFGRLGGRPPQRQGGRASSPSPDQPGDRRSTAAVRASRPGRSTRSSAPRSTSGTSQSTVRPSGRSRAVRPGRSAREGTRPSAWSASLGSAAVAAAAVPWRSRRSPARQGRLEQAASSKWWYTAPPGHLAGSHHAPPGCPGVPARGEQAGGLVDSAAGWPLRSGSRGSSLVACVKCSDIHGILKARSLSITSGWDPQGDGAMSPDRALHQCCDRFAPGFTDDPYPRYAALRERGARSQAPARILLLARYDETCPGCSERSRRDSHNIT